MSVSNENDHKKYWCVKHELYSCVNPKCEHPEAPHCSHGYCLYCSPLDRQRRRRAAQNPEERARENAISARSGRKRYWRNRCIEDAELAKKIWKEFGKDKDKDAEEAAGVAAEEEAG